ncbi:related to peptide transporter [Rhynchosporium secalis]|uniref:Related to peptide transporter n=1 Tax=Rhynchosporium secalis TaxID=38038 RepID=A0A1E1MJ98_RHYSE|nr:related to peptide transporter [Rhynchosporium secalis]
MSADKIQPDGNNPIEGKITTIPSHVEIAKKMQSSVAGEKGDIDVAINPLPGYSSETGKDSDTDDDAIIVTGEDASKYLLPLRDDFEPALTFRSMFLCSGLCIFQAVMFQIYQFKPTNTSIQGTFTVLIAYFIGNAWSKFLPRGDKFEARWRAKGNTGKVPTWIAVISFFNHGEWNLKEHAICAITSTSASNAAPTMQVFAAQDIFYDMKLNAATVVLSTLSIGLFGYGVAGLLRSTCVWHVEAVFWGTLPTVKTLQGLHWQEIKSNKPIRYFWYAFSSMFAYEFFPAYIFPWLNSVSIPCLAAMKATGSKGDLLRNLFGGSNNNEGLGLFSLSFDWQYIASSQTSLPLSLQTNMAFGTFICLIAMLAIYYGNAFGSRSLPFMSTRLLTQEGKSYPSAKAFVGGVLDKGAVAKYGIPRLTGTFAYSMFMANAAIGALIAHVALFYNGDIKTAIKSSRSDGVTGDRHHQHMAKHYKETPWYWFFAVLVFAFILGLVVVIKENITLPAWAYVFSLLLGSFIAPFSTLLYSRYGTGIATNNLSKMIAGLMLPERPVGNMYFATWSHNVISNVVSLCSDLKQGEYLKIPPRVMFLAQIYGTILGGFINYLVMIYILTGNRDLLRDTDGNSSWSGATIQSYNTNASSWALAKYLYKSGGTYSFVPYGLLVGAGFVALHRVVVHFYPKRIIGAFSLADMNFPLLIYYAGYIPSDASQTCVLFSQLIGGFFVQFYLRNYRPRIFRDYSYLVTGAWDGASLTVLFILSFAVFGAGGPAIPFPKWWGNNSPDYGGNYDFCPVKGA